MDRLTERNESGGISVKNLSAALKLLAEYEDRLERAETIMPLADIERVLRDGEWLDETYWDYINLDCVPHDWAIELKRAADAVLELINTTYCR